MSIWFNEKFFEKAREVDYIDLVVYSLEEIEVAYRGNSLEENIAKNTVYAVRAFNKGCWSIKSTYNLKLLNQFLEKVVTEAKVLSEKSKPTSWYKIKKPVKGRFKIEKQEIFNMDRVRELVETICDRIKDRGCRGCETIITCSKITKTYVSSEGAEATEERGIVEIAMFAISQAYRKGIAGDVIGFSGAINSISDDVLFKIADGIAQRSKSIANARSLHPLRRGLKWNVVLDSTITGAIFHELAHMLEADAMTKKLSVPLKATTFNITIVDDPTLPWGYGSYIFDDEGVHAKRKKLIEDGEIVSLLHTRETAFAWNTEPTANARGIFHKPKALMSNLIVKPSDWTFSELIEETKEGIYAEGLVKAEISDDGIITIVPEAVWIIKKGEIREPVSINYLKLQIPKHLNNIEGLGKELKQRVSIEKGHRVSEYAPPMKIKSIVVG